MAMKLPSFKFFKAADAKSRVFIIFAALSAFGIFVFLIMRYFGGGPVATESKVAAAPSSLQTVPGAQMTPEFYRATVQAGAQAAKQAQMTGGSAVAPLINVPGQQGGFPEQSCTLVCPSDETANVADDINNLVKEGKLSQEDGNRLLELAKNNVPVDQYAAALNELVRTGKLTPEQARLLLDKYKKQHANMLNRESSSIMDPMIKAGQLPIDTANQLLVLQKSGISPAAYAAELDRLVREGKLTPEAAARLLAQYTQQQIREQAKECTFSLQQMVKAGEVTPEVGNGLLALQNKSTPADQYGAELNRLVQAGKLTPAVAAKLLNTYTQQCAGISTAAVLNSLPQQAQAEATKLLSDLVKSGVLSQDDANAIAAIEKNAQSTQDCQAGLGQFFQTKKIPPDVQQKLLQSCSKMAAVNALTQRLKVMQGNKVTVDAYTNELKRAVQAGLITPEMATKLLNEYRATLTPVTPPPGIAPGAEANIPGGAEFAQLQQRLQAGTPVAAPAVETAQFANVQQQIQGETAQEHQQRIAQMAAAMSGQAQTLLASWQPPTMSHKEGASETAKPGTTGATGVAGATGAAGTGTATSSGAAVKRPLIKAGTILFAVLDTAVDSDYPDTPVMATIVQGDFKGAKLLGKLALAQGQDKVSLNFTMMDMDAWTSAKSVSAFAIDPDTARTVMASDVDYHYLKRYGAMMGSSFLSGYANAITTAGSTTTTGIFGTSTVHPQLSPASKIAVGMGQIGTTMGTQVANYINTPTTVKVNSGVGLGILFMSEVTE